MKSSKKLLFLPCLALSLVAVPVFAGISESNTQPKEIAVIQPQARIQPVPFDGAPEALHIISGLVAGAWHFNAYKAHVPLSSKIIGGTIVATCTYLFSKWFDRNVMN